MENREPISIFSLCVTCLILALLFWYALLKDSLGTALTVGGIFIIFFTTLLWSKRALHKLRVELNTDREHLFPGDHCTFTLTLENKKFLPVWITLDLVPSASLSGFQEKRVETRLLSWEEGSRSWKVKAETRGIYPLGRGKIFAGDLIGFKRRERDFGSRREIIIYPRVRPLKPADIKFHDFFGIHASKGLIEDPAWYAGTRDYTGNKPAKSIHWKASAHLGTLQEKLYEPTSHQKVLLILDLADFSTELVQEPETKTCGNPGEAEELLEAAASLAYVLAEHGASFGLVTNASLKGGRSPLLPLGRGPEHLGRLLEILARVEIKAETELKTLLENPLFRGAGNIYLGYTYNRKKRELCGRVLSRKQSLLGITVTTTDPLESREYFRLLGEVFDDQ